MSINNPSKPMHTNMRSAGEQKGGIRLSIRTKITLWAGLCLAVVSLILIGYSVITLRQTAIDNSTREAAAIAEANARSVEGSLNAPLVSARTLAYSLSAIKDSGIPISLSRDEVNAMLRKTLMENPSFLGTYTLWEPNTFDGSDDRYIRAVAHDDTGRFIPYWVRGDDGIIHTEALTQYETPDVGDWYILPRSTKQEIIIAPIFRRIQDQDVVIASFIIPIIQNDKFYGIAGVDAPIGFIQELVDSIDLYDGTANAVLFTDTGTLIAVRQQPELTNQSASLIYEDFDKIQHQLSSSFTRMSPDGNYLQIFSPIDVNNSGTHWIIGLIIPIEKITAPATSAAVRQAGISTILIVLALVFLWFLAGRIVRPLQVLTNTAKAVSEGQWTVAAEVHSNDETEMLANAFNTMTSQLRDVFGTLEQQVADRTRALANVAEISTVASNFQNEDEMLATVVHLVQRRFGLYHAHVFTYHEDQEELQIVACGYKEGDEHEGTHGTAVIPLSQEQSLVARAGRSQKPVIVNDVRSDPGWLPNPLLPDTAAELAVPLLIGDKLIGVLDVQSDKVNTFTESDADIQMTLGAQIAVASQNIRQYEDTRKIASDMGVVAAVSIATSTITETGRLLQDMVDLSKKSFGLYHVHIYLFNEAGNALNLTAGADEVGRQMVAEKRSIPLDSEQSLVARAARTGEGVVVNDVTLSQDFLPNPLLPDTRAELAVPMMVGGKVIGVLDVQSETVGRFTQVDVNIQTTLASQVAVALQNARSFAQAQRQAEREAELNLMTQRIQGTTSIEAALQIAAREIGHALGMKPTLVSLAPSALTSNQTDDTQLSQN